ncbi:MAG: hypothetical protein HY369_00605 [Candidatus Aenigmarchaeota archaeon]|nr:hypothetical protein [Candidatus Aenigmarchaeota archaeon]
MRKKQREKSATNPEYPTMLRIDAAGMDRIQAQTEILLRDEGVPLGKHYRMTISAYLSAMWKEMKEQEIESIGKPRTMD